MSDDHINGGGFTSPSKAERLEHAEISSVHGKKVFNVDSSGNLVNPATSEKQTNGSQKTQIVDGSNNTIVPPSQTTTSEEAILLRRLVKLLESNAVVDIGGRQKVTLDFVSVGTVATGIPVSGLTSGAGIPSTNYPTGLAPIQQPGTANWQPVWIGPVDQRFQIIDAARLTYNQGIRSHLSFT